MLNFSKTLTAGILLSILLPCCKNSERKTEGSRNSALENSLREYVAGKGARIGVAVIDHGDTIAVNGREVFPMMSVFKFPLALCVAHLVDIKGSTLDEQISISTDDLKENTYSPMLKKYGRRPMKMSLRELLEWSIKESDNNAADILLKYVGGVAGMNELMEILKLPSEISVGASEDDMHRDTSKIYLNNSTPIAMAALFDKFNREMRTRTASYAEIASMLETCQTGRDRIAAGISDSRAVLGHKTGTGDILPSGHLSALNDAGYIITPHGQTYSIAVFVAESPYDIDATSAMIADLSAIVFESKN